MPAPSTVPEPTLADRVCAVVADVWGYDSLRPLQLDAMIAAGQRRDALVVLPTGGGKSLCYQAPALLGAKPTVVVSPLIALMKDQVDSLTHRGVPAACINSALDYDTRRTIAAGIRAGAYRLILVAPERLATEPFLRLLEAQGVGTFAIDEAHCISHWGHDFRADYRKLGLLRERFPDVPIQAYTATATPPVRDDIVAQLHLRDPAVLVGDFFRPNLVYRAARRRRVADDVAELLADRVGQAGIIYCIRRRDVDDLAAELGAAGWSVRAYHAGLSDAERTATQDAFAAGAVDIIIATVAFGMGIDRTDIRFVIHAALPKSIEHYQQETGRAGRDDQPSDCILLYSGSDLRTWRHLIENNAGDSSPDHALHQLNEMYRYAAGLRCRHESLVGYFGQAWTRSGCAACDVCRGEIDVLPDSADLARLILAAVHETGERFGPAYVGDVLRGALTDKVTQRGHDHANAFGALSGQQVTAVRSWIDQLTDQHMLARVGEYGVLAITDAGRRELAGAAAARLIAAGPPPRRRPPARSATGGSVGRPSTAKAARSPRTGAAPSHRDRALADGPLNAVDQVIFEHLRALRRSLAEELEVPPYRVFADRVLRAIVRAKPTDLAGLRAVPGVGPAKLEAFGRQFLDALQEVLAEG